MNTRNSFGRHTCAVVAACLAAWPQAVRGVDCNGNGVADATDISLGTSEDCNGNAIPDECDLSGVLFAPVTYNAIAGGATAVRSADLDQDGDLDLVVAGGSQNVAVLWNLGAGVFSAPDAYVVPNEPASLALADLNGDGYPEIVAGRTGGGMSILRNNGDHTFGPRVDYAINRTRDVAAADLDGDDDLDLIIITWNYGYEQAKVRVWLNDGSGSFPSQTNYTVGNSIQSIVAADLDGDNDIDLAVADGKAACSCIHILLNNGNGTFQAPVDRVVGGVPNRLVGADLDGDGDVDLALVKNSYVLSILLNNGSATFSDTTDRGGFSSVLYWLEPVDLDRDGDVDLVFPNGNRGSLSFLLNRGNATFGITMHVKIESSGQGKNPYCIAAADLDNDNWPDLASADADPPDVAVLLNRSVPSLSRDYNQNGIPDECECVKPADWDGDTDVDHDDWLTFEGCASGPMIPVAVGCEDKDLDCDGDIDQADFSIFQRCYSGENVEADPTCGN